MTNKKMPLCLILACGLSSVVVGSLSAEPPTKSTYVERRKGHLDPLLFGITGGSRGPVEDPVLPADDVFLKDGLVLFLRPQKAQFSATEPVIMIAGLLNRRREALPLSGFALSEIVQGIKVQYQGQEVPLTAFGRDHLAQSRSQRGLAHDTAQNQETTINVAPGNSMTYELCLSRMFDMSRPGTYAVTLSMKTETSASNGTFSLVSNPAAIVVHEPDMPWLLGEYVSDRDEPPVQFPLKF